MRRLFTLMAIVLVAACSGDNQTEGPMEPPEVPLEPVNPFVDFNSEIYEDLTNWLCHPDLADADNVCMRNLDSTVVFADGSTELEEHEFADDPAVDCFYVYPTVSGDPGGNADLEEGIEEEFTTLNQAARYSSFCRMFAPVYRQVTVAAIFSDVEVDRELAYGDVVDAFKQYIANDNDGRGFLLIGHSQGASHLRQLIMEVIETDSVLLDRLVAAHLLGSSVQIPVGADVGATFREVGVCRTADQIGCVVSYATYREEDPFLLAGEGVFGLPGDGTEAVCVNPAAPSGGRSELSPYFPTATIPALDAVIIDRADGPFADPTTAPEITTPFYSMPDFIRAECMVDDNGVSYLEASVLSNRGDPRADDFNGEFVGGDGWGLHLVDVTVAMGDLVLLGFAQTQAWLLSR